MREAVLFQRIEGGLIFLAALAFLTFTGTVFAWWAALLIFFIPDLTFAAYALGPRMGAVIYNLMHIYALGLILLVAGLVFALPALAAIGALWLGHAGMDRALGYGLKLPSGFQNTHLGRIGPRKN
ncbi:DUF4260 domain-containing protein [Ketogulonicigenium vulgare]|uniref:DUF4260 family protein n=1 Tax=Ketogulonicigenium vulgare (strain WSH-001) TaxID=759362 RepID=F9Y502_KETVW|nr:DUF4260 domain-containing protein [Ketogulonicigenium vulgare]ADO42434.1 conserved hypothetical protein [Ketogulonicigenium vulgare Y25]AEM40634.1 hypothetical protein KVU_0795 [Ketogulonicigenium vulgare WSH-001]ALJ80807.1 hypothetical protein KVH_06230 [Ketogulonicigenium vulgare]ANW33588.1 hypothetical protein KvSKV_06200 [Ketogulonicigenium vulgare]AOZ54348.1 hypothetical protein KVC_1331 [Ketogulonicigenium vulgare]